MENDPSYMEESEWPDVAEFKTIDELIEYQKPEKYNMSMYKNIYHFLLVVDASAILEILKSKTNKPSKHDLGIIDGCRHLKNKANKPMLGKYISARFVDKILEFYETRKET